MKDLTYDECREALLELVLVECERRLRLYKTMIELPGDSKEIVEAKVLHLKATLHEWAQDPVRCMNDIGWAPDPKGLFGGRGKIPAHLAPAGMVPIILYPRQEELVRQIDAAVNSDFTKDVNLLKPRQWAATSIVLDIFKQRWLFKDGETFIVSTYKDDKIDGGGSGDRKGDSLFAKLRMAIDAIFWCFKIGNYSQIRFNQHLGPWHQKKFKGDLDNVAWLGQSDDKHAKLTRPGWFIHGEEMFPGGKGNLILGELPSDQMAKSNIITAALLDELGEYGAIGPDIDRKAFQACRPCCNHIIMQGTLPLSGAHGLFKENVDEGDTNPTLVNFEASWTDIAAYMLGGWWACRSCNHEEKWPRAIGPGVLGVEKKCEKCGTEQLVKEKDCSSPWFEMIKASLRNDRVALARYYWKDWGEAVGDRAFFTFSRDRAVVPRPSGTNVPHEDWITLDGFDPGWSKDNPAAWMRVRFSRRLLIPRVVAWTMAAQQVIEWWVPFFKGINPQRILSTSNPFVCTKGANAGRLWRDVHHYTDDEFLMMSRASRYRMGEIEGDKYGSHQDGTGETQYGILEKFGVYVRYEYTKDRADLIGKARDLWVPRIEIDPEIAEYRPQSPDHQKYPSLTTCFDTAKMRTTASGQGESARDIDKNNPKHVSHPIDAFLYLCRALPNEVEAVSDPGGEFHILGEQEEEVVTFGETFGGQF